ncbi:hypothetical protein L484_021778 [Morus notabilis]|uniref:Remorin C-terminal domain-containing protein n=1 Tax=Morus notabilis TaxID=981085 RepID=W9QSM1_9ROSA|nr:hypothetical protein L484_021778 [Morus notabilis]
MITKRRTSFTQTEKTILMTTEPTIDCFKHKGPRKSNVSKSSMACSSWDMNSLREVLPESPSPICSTASTSPLSSPTCSHKADTFFTQLPIESSPTPRNQRKLEKKRAKALEKLEKRISTTKAEADQKTAKARQETIKKIAAISKVSSKTLATKNSSWIKLIRLS